VPIAHIVFDISVEGTKADFIPPQWSSSKSLLANVLDIDDDFRHNCRPMTPGGTLPHNPAFYRTVYG